MKLRAGRYMIDVGVTETPTQWRFSFKYNKDLLEQIKLFAGRRWVPETKEWIVPKNRRNQFQLEYLQGKNPYAWYDRPLDTSIKPRRDCLMQHQIAMLQHVMTYKRVILACEMGTGKTLACIEALEAIGSDDVLYVSNVSGCAAVRRELRKWQSKISIHPVTYDYMRDQAKVRPRDVIVFDECSQLKGATAKRTHKAWEHAELAQYVIMMSGTPAPKDPTDWWALCETACPGFIREGDTRLMKASLGKVTYDEGMSGMFPKFHWWWDDENRCAVCGKIGGCTCFTKSENKVAKLYSRMRGLVFVKFKKDCMDLPDKVYERVRVKPTVEMLRAWQLIKSTAPRAVTALMLARELSDGFQYKTVEGALVECGCCHGTGTTMAPAPDPMTGLPDTTWRDCCKMAEGTICAVCMKRLEYVPVTCGVCDGSGQVRSQKTVAEYVGSPKIDTLKELVADLDRVVIWAGFTATVDLLTDIMIKEGWTVLTIDGRGMRSSTAMVTVDELLTLMETPSDGQQRVCVVAHPEAGGMGLTFTSAGVAIYYSNSFKGEARFQSEDRIHRTGMDKNRAPRIIDLLCLPSDTIVLENLLAKRKLQALSMGDLAQGVSDADPD